MTWVKGKRKYLICTVLGGICFLAAVLPFVSSTDFDLIRSDEYDYVLASPVKYGLTPDVMKSVWTETRGAIWMPLTRLSYAVDHEIAKRFFNVQYPHYYEACPPKELVRILHAHNIFIHGVNASLLFLFLLMMLKRIKKNDASNTNDLPYCLLLAAFVGAVLWAVHPLRAEPVCWVASRKDLLALFWTLAGLILWLVAMSKEVRPRWSAYFTCMVAMALAVWSKPTSVIFPVLVLGIDWLRCPCLSDKAWAMRMLLVLPFFVISLLGGSMGWIAHAEVKPMYIPFWVTPVLAALNLGAYCWKTIIPVYLHYPYLFIRALPSWYVFVSFGVGLALVWLFSMFSSAIRRNHRELFGIGILFFASLMLVLFRPVGWQSHADRFIYLAGIWVSLGISLWLVRQPTKRFWGGVLVCGVVCVLLGRLSWRQATYWQNDATLFARAEACSNPGMNVFANKGLMLDAYRRRDLRACLAIAQKQRIAWMDHYVSGMVPMLVLLSYEQRRGDMVRKIHDDLQKNYLIHLQKRVSKVSDSRMTPMYPDSSGLSFPMQINNIAMFADPEAEEHEIIRQSYMRSIDFCKLVMEILATKDIQQAKQRLTIELEQDPRSTKLWYLSGLLSKQTRDFEGMKKAWEFCLRNDPSYAFLEKEMRR